MKKRISGWLAVLGLALGLTFSATASAESEGIAWDKAPKTNDVPACRTAPSCSSTTA
jgi:ubiquinol-cytochrome c reductase cytochrome c1 subunit